MRLEEEQTAKATLKQLAWALAARDHARSLHSVREERAFNDAAAAECQIVLLRLLGRLPTQAEVNEVIGLD